MYEQINSTHILRTFDDWNEMVRFADEAPRIGGCSSRNHDYSFTHTRDWNACKALALSGWREGADAAATIGSGFFAHVSSLIEREEIVYDVEGMDFDVARVLEGEPECWMRYEYHTANGPGRRVMRWVYNCEVSGGLSTTVINNRGAAILAAIQLLEYAGHGVELWVVGPIGNGRHMAKAGEGTRTTSEYRIKVKAADQPLDPPRVAFALGHPSMLRRVMFALQERLPEPWHTPSLGGYGSIHESRDQGDVYISGAFLDDVQWTSAAAIERWIMDQLTKAGVELHVAKK